MKLRWLALFEECARCCPAAAARSRVALSCVSTHPNPHQNAFLFDVSHSRDFWVHPPFLFWDCIGSDFPERHELL